MSSGVPLDFAKYEGTDNDFLVLDADVQAAARLDAAQATRLCARHRGVGADGVLVVGLDARQQPFMRVFNADGSRPGMCGNGVRCAAFHLVRTGRVDGPTVSIQTDSGPHACTLSTSPDGDVEVEVEMRPASFDPAEVPVQAEQPLVDTPIDVDGEQVEVTAVSMGNPHVVVFAEADARRVALGPRLETDSRFPAGTNVGLAHMVAPNVIDLVVWERGVGWTRGCGTGACAAAAAAVETGRAARNQAIEVRLPGGPLHVHVPERGTSIRMRGPVRHIFDGHLDLARFR